ARMTSADDGGLIAQAGIVTLLHAGVEGVAVDMRYGQPFQFRMGDETGRSAGRAARRPLCRDRQAISAERTHWRSPGFHSQAAPRTPLESPWRGGKIRVATWSEKTWGRISAGTFRYSLSILERPPPRTMT